MPAFPARSTRLTPDRASRPRSYRRTRLASALPLLLLPLVACESEIGPEPSADPGKPAVRGHRNGMDSLELAIVLENPDAIFGQQLDIRLQARNPTQDTIAFNPIDLIPRTTSWLLDGRTLGPYPLSQQFDGTMLLNDTIDLPPGATFVGWGRLNPLVALAPSDLGTESRHRFKVTVSSRVTATSIDTAWEFTWKHSAADVAILDATHRFLTSDSSGAPFATTEPAAREYMATYHAWDSTAFLNTSPLSHYAYSTLNHARRHIGYAPTDYNAEFRRLIRAIAIDPTFSSSPAIADAELACGPLGSRTDPVCSGRPKLAPRIGRIFGDSLVGVEMDGKLLRLDFVGATRAYSWASPFGVAFVLRLEFVDPLPH